MRSPRRLTILMLVPHEPTQDPRIHYTANALARHHDVQVIATVRAKDRRPADNVVGERLYTVEAVPLELAPRAGIAWQLLSLPTAAHAGAGTVAASRREPSAVEAGSGTQATTSLYERSRANAAFLALGLSANHALQRHLAQRAIAPDLVFCHDLYTLQTGVWLKQRTGARLVYDSHEYYPFQHMHPSFVRTTLWYERRLVPHVDLYLTVSPELAAELEAVLGVARVHAIPNAEPRPPGPVVPLGREMDRLAAGRLKVLFQGTFSPGRGLEEVLADWSGVDPGRAALFLRGPDTASRQALAQQARRLGLLDRSVHLLPPVLERDLVPAAAEADIGLIPYKGDLPSYRFACPNKLSQYIHAGLAVLGNDIPFVAGMIRSNGIGWVYDVRRPGSLAEAVAAATPAAVAAAKAGARQLSSEGGYSWETYEPVLVRLVEDAAQRA